MSIERLLQMTGDGQGFWPILGKDTSDAGESVEAEGSTMKGLRNYAVMSDAAFLVATSTKSISAIFFSTDKIRGWGRAESAWYNPLRNEFNIFDSTAD